jgi:hypothetical protein
MSKSNSAEIHAPATRGAIHLVMQGKGGVGKSPVSTWLVEYLPASHPVLWACTRGITSFFRWLASFFRARRKRTWRKSMKQKQRAWS